MIQIIQPSFMPGVLIGGLGKMACEGAGTLISGTFEQLQGIGYNVLSIVQGEDGMTQVSAVAAQLHSIVSGTAIPALQGIGYSIALLFFLIALIDLLRNDRLTTEMYIKFFINLVLAVFFIYQAPNIYTTIVRFGDGLGQICAGIFGESSMWDIPTKEQIAEIFIHNAELPDTDPNHAGWFQTLILSLVVAGPCYLICFILTAVTYLIAFSRLIELAVRGAFLPIGFALLTDEGFKGAGGRYFRKFIAICAQVAALVMIAGITTTIFGIVGSNITNALLAGADVSFLDMMGRIVVLLGAGIACVSVMFKSIGLINDVFGV